MSEAEKDAKHDDVLKRRQEQLNSDETRTSGRPDSDYTVSSRKSESGLHIDGRSAVCGDVRDEPSSPLCRASGSSWAKMSSEVQRPDDSPSTSGGSSDIEQRETAPPQQERDLVAPKKKETKISSKTAAKLSTSAKRIQKELAEITLDPPPNCR
ncbi:ubiquitin-conjugating enzyme E2 E2 [Labeo rohita]|uniref:Ubiquitin-conjugating enzyme E2 E2 n=1 Tax=Labeo rohita TaxID=84645 RepID=A0A498MSF5_LABRO|nr:ubiquitin-conjugating enzyme E2 E2 [Labeo rohita]